MIKILVTDKLAQEGLDVLSGNDDVELTVKTGVSEDELASIIGDYDGLIIRSGTQVTAKVLENSGRLKGIARAGVGVDNVDVSNATQKGIVVMNTPDGNTISAAEHTIALLMALSRHIPQGCSTLKAGKWDRKKFMGTQLMGKTLGVIGLGRIGMSVARRALGLKMKVIGYDPIAAPETAEQDGVQIYDDMIQLCKKCDYLTLHVPVTDQTRGMINADLFKIMKPSAKIINVARGAVVNEDDLWAALKGGTIGGAALDVFSKEPPVNRGFEDLDNCIVTPHLGASTEEAQIEVAIDAANELVEALRGGQMRNAINVPGQDKNLSETVKQYRALAERLAMLVGSLAPGSIQKVKVTYRGEIANRNVSAVTTSVMIGLLQDKFVETVNAVNVPSLAKQRGLSIDEVKNTDAREHTSMMSIQVVTDQVEREVFGTIVGKNIPRVIGVDDYDLEMCPEGSILIIYYADKPGVIGTIGTICGKHNLNIGTMGVGRVGDKAVLAVSLDSCPDENVIKELKSLGFVDFFNICDLPKCS